MVYVFKGKDGEADEIEDFTKVRDKVEDFEYMPEPQGRINCFFFDLDNLKPNEDTAEEFLAMIWENCSEDPIPCLEKIWDDSEEDEDEEEDEEDEE